MNANPPPSSFRAAAYCKYCKITFSGPQMALGSGSSLAFAGNLTNCPKCHRMVEMLDGSYSIINDRIQMVLAPTVSLEARVALLGVVDDVQSEKISLDEAERRAEKIEPGFGALFAISKWSPDARAAVLSTIVSGILSGLISATGSIAAAYFAPTPIIMMPTTGPAKASPSVLKRGLMSSTSQSPVHMLSHDRVRREHTNAAHGVIPHSPTPAVTHHRQPAHAHPRPRK